MFERPAKRFVDDTQADPHPVTSRPKPPVLLDPIDPNNQAELDRIGRRYWLDHLHHCHDLKVLERLAVYQIAQVDRFLVVTNSDCGCSPELQTILEMGPEGTITGDTILDAVWAAYILSLGATMDSGKNPRCHLDNREEELTMRAMTIAQSLGATTTPCDEVYGSDGTYLEYLDFAYDPQTRTLTARPIIGS